MLLSFKPNRNHCWSGRLSRTLKRFLISLVVLAPSLEVEGTPSAESFFGHRDGDDEVWRVWWVVSERFECVGSKWRRMLWFRFMGDRYKGMRTMRKRIAGNITNRVGLDVAMASSLFLSSSPLTFVKGYER